MRRIIQLLPALLLILSFIAPASWGQDQPAGSAEPERAPVSEPVDPALESPQATMRTFLTAMNPPEEGASQDLAKAIGCLDTSGVSEEAREERARMIYGILNRIGLLEVQWLAGKSSRELIDTSEYIVFPRQGTRSLFRQASSFGDMNNAVHRQHLDGKIVMARQSSGAWLISAATVAGARDFYVAVEGLERRAGADERAGSLALWIRSLMPATLRDHTLVTLEYWQWISIGIIIVVGVILDYCVRGLVLALARRKVRKRGGDAQRETWKRMVRPFGLFAAALLWFWALRLLLLPDAALRVLLVAVRLFLMLSAVWAAFRVTDLIAEVASRRAMLTSTKFDDVLIPLLRKAVKLIITVFGLIYIADSLHIEIGPLLAGLGIGGLGFAFAAKDTIENFFGSITVVADRPFEVGDWIVIGDVEGTVEELGLRSTRVRTFYNSLVTVPNATLVRATVDNFGRRKYRRAKTHLGLQYDTPPEKIDAFCEGIRELVRVHPYTRKDYYQIWLHQFGPSSLDILLYVFHEVPDWQTELRERHRLYLDILRLADRLGVQFAFPTQTIHMFQEDPGGGHEAAPLPEGGAESSAKRLGRQIVRELTANADWRAKKPGPYVFTGPSSADEDDETQIESKAGGDG